MFSNHTYNCSQKGRSLLEMLAVIGIIALLTLTALFGYRYAMATSKSQRAFRDVMNRSFAIASSASFEKEAIGEIKPPIGYDKSSGGLTFEHRKVDKDGSYSIAVSPLNQLACQKLLDMDYQETPVKSISLGAETVAREVMKTANLASSCAESDNQVVYYFDRTTGIAGKGNGSGNNPGNPIIGECDTGRCADPGLCQMKSAFTDSCGCPYIVDATDGTACYVHGSCQKGKCVCDAGYYLSGKQCLPCRENTYSKAGATSCTPCPAGSSSPEGSSECVCDDGSQWDPKEGCHGKACNNDNDCASTSKTNPYPDCYLGGNAGGFCMCKGFHAPTNCERCNESKGAFPIEKRDSWYKPRMTGCYCKDSNKRWHSKTNNCLCVENKYKPEGSNECVACGEGSSRPDWTSAENKCICDDPDLIWDPETNSCEKGQPCKTDGDCTNKRYPHCYIESGSEGYCICKGFNGPDVCVDCNPQRATWNPDKSKWQGPSKRITSCICNDKDRVWYHRINNCLCPADTYFDKETGHCVDCGEGAYRDEETEDGACLCENGSPWDPKNGCRGKSCTKDTETQDCTDPAYPDCYVEPGSKTGYCMCKGFHGPDSCIKCNESVGAEWEKDKNKWLNPPLLTGCMCPAPKIWHSPTNNCLCDVDMYKPKGSNECVPCGEDSSRPDWTSPQDKCICDDPTLTWDPVTNTCQKVKTCETDEDCAQPYPKCYTRPDGSKICACVGDHNEGATECVDCDENTGATVPPTYEDWWVPPALSRCDCKAHQTLYAGKCVCDEGYVWNPETKECEIRPSCSDGGFYGEGCSDRTFLSASCNGTPSVSGKPGDAVITVSFCSVGSTPGSDGKGCIKGTFKTIQMHRQKMKNGGEFYAGGEPASWYDTQIICETMKQADKGFKATSNDLIRFRKNCKHPRRIRSALKMANPNLAGPNTPRRVWDVANINKNKYGDTTECLISTHDVRSGVIQNAYKIRELNASENTFISGGWATKDGGARVWVDGGSVYPLCYHRIAPAHCDDDDTSDDPE